MNTHALAATTTRQPEMHPTTEEWIVHTATVTLAWSALDAAVYSFLHRACTHPCYAELTVIVQFSGDSSEHLINEPPIKYAQSFAAI